MLPLPLLNRYWEKRPIAFCSHPGLGDSSQTVREGGINCNEISALSARLDDTAPPYTGNSAEYVGGHHRSMSVF
ncbi:hypothetical protein PoB_005178900 [Plakobranchus ocellatus]|uniref:Uncharacterized protein n=1 Tax=Plakobranchus ocellatus TaxID=259542 RepID=A0AAV4C2E3_9GAST|nr:hypothetical protein PoB_005178900 [Plakobranchus ocellatus]